MHFSSTCSELGLDCGPLPWAYAPHENTQDAKLAHAFLWVTSIWRYQGEGLVMRVVQWPIVQPSNACIPVGRSSPIHALSY